MAPQELDPCTRLLQHERAEQSQAPIPHHEGGHAAYLPHPLQQGAGCGQGLHEHGGLWGETFGDRSQVRLRQGEALCEGPRALQDPEHASLRAVPGISATAQVAGPAARVDLPHDALAAQPPREGPPHELMAGNPGEPHVASAESQVRSADPRQLELHQDLALRRHGLGKIVSQPQAGGIKPEPAHGQSTWPMQMETLWPPKPSELQRALRTSICRAAPGT